MDLDAAGRPLTVEAEGWQESYAYDQAGNQTEAAWPEAAGRASARGERTYAGTRIVSAGSMRYEHDASGRMTLRQKTRLSRKPDTWRYEWDTEDRLTACTTPDGTRWTYAYDPLGRRTAKYRHNADGSLAEAVYFTWDGTRLAEQFDTDTGVSLTWDHEGHRPLTQCERKALTQDEFDSRFFAMVTDLVGTPTELVDERGDIAWHTRTTLWGTTTWNRDAVAYTPLRFPGQYADPETGLHYNYFRHYDPDTARYVTPDPLGLEPAPNPVTYPCNPGTWSDALGLAPCAQFRGIQWMTDKLLKRPSFKYQRLVTGQKYEQVWRLSNGREVHVDGGPANGWITEAKFTGGSEAEWSKSQYNPEHRHYDESKITDQAGKLLDLNREVGGNGVRYAISNEAGARHFSDVLGKAFPEAMADGSLAVHHVPGNGMSGMSKWL
jgi:RHS repeat-associated protein